MNNSIISLKNIHLSFNRKKIFNNFNIEFYPGDKIVLQGKSGLGKTSLLHLILGFVLADQGEIRIDDISLNEKTVWDIRKKIAYIDQDVSLPNLIARQWISSIFNLKLNTQFKNYQEELRALLEYFELSEKDLEKNISELSGGEKQRLAIIVSILLKRKIFLLDEITSSLDQSMKDKTASFFVSHPEWTLLIISHDPCWKNYEGIKIFDLERPQWKQ